MLSLHLPLGSAAGSWRTTDRGVAVGCGYVEPFRHAALESVAAASDDDLLIVVRERCATADGSSSPAGDEHFILPVSADRLEAIQREALDWPLQATLIRVSRAGEHTQATIRAGRWGTAPLFVATAKGELWAHWNPSALLPRLRDRGVDPELAAHYLATFDTPYSRRTMLRDVQMITERATATWTNTPRGTGWLTIDYPPAIRPARPRRLKADADVEKTFLAIVESSMRRWLVPGARAMSELSGGLDSAIVSACAARLTGARWKTCGLLLSPSYRLDQFERRAELIERFRLDDRTADLADALPLARGAPRAACGAPVMPWEECYYEAMDDLLGSVAADGTTVLMTGFGGDELCTLYEGEGGAEASDESARGIVLEENIPNFLTDRTRQAALDVRGRLDESPASAAATSVESAAFASAMYLRHGIWPIHPLCTPELVRFCGSLPAEWRAGRAVERRSLARAGCSRRVSHGTADSFAPALAESLRTRAHTFVEGLFCDSLIADAGYVDGGRLQQDFALWANGAGDPDCALPFYSAATLELTLRSLASGSGNVARTA